MYINSFLIIFFCVLSTKLYGQANYFNDQLIIKFNDTSQNFNFKLNQSVSSIFTEYNIDIESPVWTETRTKRLIKKRKTTNNIDYKRLFESLENTFYASFKSDIDPLKLAEILTSLPQIEYAEPRFIYKTNLIETNDPINNNFVDIHKFPEAWDLNKGSADIIIGIVDSGVNYNHEDLINKRWINEDEIPNNGIDDDNNGFIDDYLGWDFWESGWYSYEIVSDNDPFAEHNSHGTHVAGIATAEANNGVGLVGAGYNARYMAVKAGGIKDDPTTTEIREDRAIGYGNEGILYAFENGAQIINCSFGGLGLSSFEDDVLRTVTEGGSLVIAASGNEDTNTPKYPAAHENVLSVGAMETNGVKAYYSNYGSTVDVFAVGTITSSVGVLTDGYESYFGTSMASPVVAGLAALLKAQNPTWSPERIKFQITSTVESIDDLNSGFEPNSFGKGSINAFKALEKPVPILIVESLASLNNEGNALNLNEEGVLKLNIKNIGGYAESVSMTATSSNTNFNFEVSEVNIGSLNTGEVKEVEIPISLEEDFSKTLSANLTFKYIEATTGFTDENTLEYRDLQFKTLQGNNIAISFSPVGTIGFYDAREAIGGIGFVPNANTAVSPANNLLYEGAIIMEANGRLVNSVSVRNDAQDISRDFNPVYAYTISSINNGMTGTTTFSPFETTQLDDLIITLSTYAFDSPELENAVVLNYNIYNSSLTRSFSDVYLGIFNDWDIGDPRRNSTAYNSEEDILYIYEDPPSTNGFVSVATLNTTSSAIALDNNFDGSFTSTQFGINDEFTRAEKRNTLKAGTEFSIVNNVDVSTVVASGPFYIAPKTTTSIGFVYAYGNTLDELISNINAARNLDIIKISDINTNTDLNFPEKFSLFQNYPNPFNPNTNIRFNLSSSSNVSLTIYNSIGRKILTVVNDALGAGIHTYTVDMSQYASGMYLAQIITDSSIKTIPLTLIK